MTGLDTNIFVRLFAKDNAAQLKKAKKFITENCTPQNPGHVSIIVLVELLWVLRRIHQYDRQQISQVIQALLTSKDLQLAAEAQVLASLEIYECSKLDFPDILIGEINKANGCTTTKTFDKKAAKLDSFSLI